MGFWNWFGQAFAETTDQTVDRANVRFILPQDSRLYIKDYTRKSLNEKFEWIWQNFGIVKQSLSGISRHVIGKGVSLQIDAEDDPDLCETAEQDFENYALTAERCDLAGRRNFYEAQSTAIEQRLGRGEFWCALTNNPAFNNEPCFHLYDTEEIQTPPDMVKDKQVIDGVELSKDGLATAYWIRGLDESFSKIPRGQMLHWFKPHAINQSRGITDFAQAVNSLVDIHELKRLATRSAKAQQLLALMMKGVRKTKKKGAFGAINQAGVNSDGTPDADAAQIEQLAGASGAGIVYTDEEMGDVKIIESKTPNPLVEQYVTDLLLRDACASWGMPIEFFWKPEKLNGNTLRAVLAQADLFFQVLGSQMTDRFSSPVAFRYISHRISIGALKPFKDPNWMFKLSWQMPPRVTVDNQREAEIMVDLMRNGMMTLREFFNARGLNYKWISRQWLREIKQFIDLAEREGLPDEYVQRLTVNLPLWRAPQPGQGFLPTDPLAKVEGGVAAPAKGTRSEKLARIRDLEESIAKLSEKIQLAKARGDLVLNGSA